MFPGDPDPTGRRVVLVSVVDGPGGHLEHLWVAPLGGGEATELAVAQMVRNPEWTPDGEALLFESDRESFRDLFRVPVAGGTTTRLTDAPNGSFEPTLSFDGQRLAFGTSRDGNAEIWTAAADGSGQARFTDHPADDVHPVWLPDGRLSWISHRDVQPRVWVRDADGADHPLRADPSDASDLDLAWSRGGVAALVVQTGPRDLGIELRTARGGLIARVDGPGPDEHPSWSPDGEWLAFTSSRTGTPQVWIVPAGGGEAVQVSTCTRACWLPRWVVPAATPDPPARPG